LCHLVLGGVEIASVWIAWKSARGSDEGLSNQGLACLWHRLCWSHEQIMLNEIHDTSGKLLGSPEIDPSIVDSKRLQMFYASVKEGSFAGAAQILSVSPSAISHAMKSLEEDLGCSLFRRFGPQVKPTGAAVRLLPMVEDLLVRMASMKAELAALDGRVESLVFRLPPSLLGILQTGPLATFHECFPAANLDMVVRGSAGSDLPGMRVDFDIDYVEGVPDGIVRRDLGSEDFHAYVAPFHRLGQKSKVSAGELRECLLIFQDQLILRSVNRFLGREVDVELRKWILPDPQVACDLARQGQGVAFLSKWAVGNAVQDGTLVRIKLPGLTLCRTCCAWWEPSRPLTWVAEVFLSLFSESISRTVSSD
jgi:DNA-binding transcriptional LysR family regulator